MKNEKKKKAAETDLGYCPNYVTIQLKILSRHGFMGVQVGCKRKCVTIQLLYRDKGAGFLACSLAGSEGHDTIYCIVT